MWWQTFLLHPGSLTCSRGNPSASSAWSKGQPWKERRSELQDVALPLNNKVPLGPSGRVVCPFLKWHNISPASYTSCGHRGRWRCRGLGRLPERQVPADCPSFLLALVSLVSLTPALSVFFSPLCPPCCSLTRWWWGSPCTSAGLPWPPLIFSCANSSISRGSIACNSA